MTEWEVVGVIIALVALLTAIVTPILRLSSSITKLNTVLSHMERSVVELKNDNQRGHDHIWKKLDDHENRIEANEKSIIRLGGLRE